MPMYKKQSGKLAKIKEIPFKKEKDLQALTEAHLESIFGLQFVKTEHKVQNLFIDTLAYDPENKSFVIIEYKRDKSFSVVDQGFSYLSLMLNNKADFILTYNESCNKSLRREDIDWSQSRIIFIARSYTAHQQNAVNFKNMPFELWEAVQYENDLIQYRQIEVSKDAESIDKLGNVKGEAKKVTEEVKKYTEEDFLGTSGERYDLYQALKEKVLQIDGAIHPNPKRSYIAFQLGDHWRNIFYVNKLRGGFALHLPRSKPSDYDDPKGKLTYLENSQANKNTDLTALIVNNEQDLPYAQMIIQQVYDRFVKEFGS